MNSNLIGQQLGNYRLVRRLGGEPPRVLYCPDSFGHPAILPELARGFGCDIVVLWRGYGGGEHLRPEPGWGGQCRCGLRTGE